MSPPGGAGLRSTRPQIARQAELRSTRSLYGHVRDRVRQAKVRSTLVMRCLLRGRFLYHSSLLGDASALRHPGPKTITMRMRLTRAAEIKETARQTAFGGPAPAQTRKGMQRKIGFGTGLKTFSPLLCMSFLQGLDQALNVERKKMPFSICLQTYHKIAADVYKDGVEHQDVKHYVGAFYGTAFERKRNGRKERPLAPTLLLRQGDTCCKEFWTMDSTL